MGMVQVLATEPDHLLQRLVETVVQVCQAESAGVSILEDAPSGEADHRHFRWHSIAGAFASHAGAGLPEEFAPCAVVIGRDRTLLFERPARHFSRLREARPAIAEALLVPFHHEGTPIGTVWALTHTPGNRFDAEDERLIVNLAQFAAAGHQLECRVGERTEALEAALAEQERLSRRLRDFAVELSAVEHRERKRLAALLHDSLQQQLVAAQMRLKTASGRKGQEAIREARQLIDGALDSSRNLTDELRPPMLYEAGLVPVLHWLADETRRLYGLHVTVNGGDDAPPLGDEVSAMLFEAVRELLFNAAKYSGATAASVDVDGRPGRSLCIAVADQGRGFDIDTQPEGFGLFSVRERLFAFGGSMAVNSAVGRGTRVTLEVPVAAASAGAGGQ